MRRRTFQQAQHAETHQQVAISDYGASVASFSAPPFDSPHISLKQPTPNERLKIWRLVHDLWGDALSLDQFLKESAYLLTVPLAKDSGMTMWILVDDRLSPDQRPILSSCETFKKRALLADGNGEVEDVVMHAIASVFCDPKHRGNGYAKRMMSELGMVLKTWQIEPSEKCVGSMLYSDIGKKYYANLGWEPAGNNSHLEFPAVVAGAGLADAHLATKGMIRTLCAWDLQLIRKKLAEGNEVARKRLMVIPDHEHMMWHHSKEDFASEALKLKFPFLDKGVSAMSGEAGCRVWAIWTRRFYGLPNEQDAGNTLYILRLTIEDENPTEEQKSKLRDALRLVLRRAQGEAAYWKLSTVKMWDPSPLVLELVAAMDIQYVQVAREEEGIASLMWYGDGSGDDERPELIVNEKYAWC